MNMKYITNSKYTVSIAAIGE